MPRRKDPLANYFRRSNASRGVTYLIHAKGTNYVKIGCTLVDVNTRLRSIQANCPLDLEVIKTVKGIGKESEMQRLWGEKHVRGEWYELSPETIERLRAHA